MKKIIIPVVAIVAAIIIWLTAFNPGPVIQSEPVPAPTLKTTEKPKLESPYLCSVNSEMGTVDGSSFWSAAKLLPIQQANCSLNQLMMNNFLYLVADDGAGHPNFMSYAPWYVMFPDTETPSWSGSYAPLANAHMAIDANQEQAGDDFKLLDVNSGVTSYDLRVNKTFFDYVVEENLYTQTGLQAAQSAYNADDKTGGIWFPPNSSTPNDVSSVEFKTSWRFYGSASSNLCPSDIMHCETDDSGYSWGLAGFHLVQKTVNHGEFVWGSFEHVGNSPDCSSGYGNPIAQNPADPANPGQTLNLNKNIASLNTVTGWNYFNFDSYTAAGGDGQNCSIPTSASQDALCLTNPKGTADDWLQVNICRSEGLSVANAMTCAGSDDDGDNLLSSACLNNSVLDNFPAGLDAKWKNYQLIGMEWISNLGTYSNGAPVQGCFPYIDGSGNTQNCPSSTYSPIGGYGAAGTVHLANSTMETWMQKGISLDIGDGHSVGETDCMGCHLPHTSSYKGAVYQGDFSHIFNRVTRVD